MARYCDNCAITLAPAPCNAASPDAVPDALPDPDPVPCPDPQAARPSGAAARATGTAGTIGMRWAGAAEYHAARI